MECVFFFKQKTAYEMRISDWSSDVCSSDLTIGGQTEKHRGNPLFQPCKGEVRGRCAGDDAGAVEKMGMALGRGQHPCGFAIGLAEVAVGGAGYEAAGAVAVLHAGEQIGKILGCEREIDRKSTRMNSSH